MKKLWILPVIAILFSLLAPMAGAAEPITGTEEGGYIVKLKEQDAGAARLFSNMDAYEISENAGLYRVDSYEDVQRLGGSVEYYEPDVKAELLALTDDRYSSYQWDLEYIKISSAWDAGYTGAGVRIAIIDSGVNSMHEDFEGTNFAKGKNILDGSNDVTDELGHGTFISGTLAAVAGNGKGIAGVCDKVEIVPIKSFKGKDTNTSYVISGIYMAVDTYNCDVINLSLGIDKDLASVREAINYAVSNGAIIISAVGNDGNSTIKYPAAYENVIGVGSVNSNGSVSDFSQKNSSVFVTAPGANLVGLDHQSKTACVRGSGTSYAAPHIAAAAVFLKEHNKKATVEDFKKILMASVRDAGTPGYDTSYGYGILDLSAFISEIEKYGFSPISNGYTDIKGHWAHLSMAFCLDNGFFTGVSSNKFNPEGVMSRGMFVTVLSRMTGEDISGYPNKFTDVPDRQYYAQPCGWGIATGIVEGTSPTTFSPNGNVTREQIAALLYRYALKYGLSEAAAGTSALSGYTDASSISGYATDAMSWAVENGIITGRTGTTLVPGGNAKRCEAATMIERFVNAFMD